MAKLICVIKVICNDCGYIWDQEDEAKEVECPICKSEEITHLDMTRYQ